jgi:hypothetical protein
MNDPEFSPYDPLARILSRWWMVIALLVIGGLVGFGFHLFLPPIYEARAVISVNMDFPKANIDQVEEDYAFNAASAIIMSSSVRDQVITEAQVRGYSITPSIFRNEFNLEGKQSVWELSVRDRDPNTAAALANIWAQISTDALNSALTHALQADQIQAQIYGLENCLGGTTPRAVTIQMDCKGYSHEVIQTMLLDQTKTLVNEKKLSLGILSVMTFGLVDLAVAPGTPILYGQGGLVLAGAFLGFLVSLWAVNTPKVTRRA